MSAGPGSRSVSIDFGSCRKSMALAQEALLIKQILRPALLEILQVGSPASLDSFERLAGLDRLQCLPLLQKPLDLFQGELPRIKALRHERDRQSHFDGSAAPAVADDHCRATARLAFERAGRRREAHGNKTHSLQTGAIQAGGK